MAECFAVPTKCDTAKRTQLLCNLKHLMTSLEDELTPKVEPVCYTPVCVTSCVPCCPPRCPPQCKPSKPVETPDILVCYKCKTDKSKKRNNHVTFNEGKELCESKSRELRGGILYVGCDCERKNGLQDNCLRTGCQGSPECLTSPPTCLPSRYCNGKHLQQRLMKNRRVKNGNHGSDDETERPESVTYQCYGAAVKIPDQKICVFLPTAGCSPDCSQF